MHLFPPTFASARTTFRELASAAGCTCEAFPISGKGPDGEELAVDIARTRGTAGDPTLVVSSGLHGVEGPLGSAIQLALLERLARDPSTCQGVRVVLIHALNPYGYAWSRRVEAHNIDVNRNFPAGTIESGSYGQFDRLLNPRGAPRGVDFFYARALAAMAVHGMPALKQALVTGQRDFPKGLFFAGNHPSQTRLIVEQHMASWIADARTVTHLDVHTGLGTWGTYKLLVDYPLSEAQRARFIRAFGPGVIEEGDARGVAYRAHGTLGEWCAERHRSVNYLFAFAECGTYGPLRIIAGLRAENRAHHWAPANAQATIRAKARLRELFCPADEKWRALALRGGLDLIDRAARELRESVQ